MENNASIPVRVQSLISAEASLPTDSQVEPPPVIEESSSVIAQEITERGLPIAAANDANVILSFEQLVNKPPADANLELAETAPRPILIVHPDDPDAIVAESLEALCSPDVPEATPASEGQDAEPVEPTQGDGRTTADDPHDMLSWSDMYASTLHFEPEALSESADVTPTSPEEIDPFSLPLDTLSDPADINTEVKPNVVPDSPLEGQPSPAIAKNDDEDECNEGQVAAEVAERPTEEGMAGEAAQGETADTADESASSGDIIDEGSTQLLVTDAADGQPSDPPPSFDNDLAQFETSAHEFEVSRATTESLDDEQNLSELDAEPDDPHLGSDENRSEISPLAATAESLQGENTDISDDFATVVEEDEDSADVLKALVPVTSPGEVQSEEAVDLRHHFLSYLVTNKPVRVTATDIVAAASILTRGHSIAVEALDADLPGDTAVALLVNGNAVIVMMVDEPLPVDVWETAAHRASWDVAPAFAAATAHVIVALIEPADTHRKAMNGAAAVTIVLAALASVVPATAAIFTEAETTPRPSLLGDHVRQLLEGQIPIPLWVGLALDHAESGPEGERRITVGTTGLRPFAGREIEFLPTTLDPLEVGRRIVGLAAYLVGNGPVIRDGDTVGMSNDERILVTYADEGSRPGVPVMLLSVTR